MNQPDSFWSLAALIRSRALPFDTRSQAVIATTVEGVIVYWNEVAVSIYGWSPSEVLGRNVLEVTPAVPVQQNAANIMQHLRSGKSWAGEFRVRGRDGVEFPVYVQDFPVRDAHGELIGIIGVSKPVE